MNRFDTLITGYSFVILTGGVIGYIMAGSTASLLMSSIFAILLIGALFLLRLWPTLAIRAIYTILTLLSLFFAYRWYNTKFMPSGLLTIATLAVLTVAVYFRKKSDRIITLNYYCHTKALCTLHAKVT